MDYKLDSEWNYAQAYLKRIDDLFIMANSFKLKHDYKLWYDVLLALHDELAAQMKDTAPNGELSEVDVSKAFRDRCEVISGQSVVEHGVVHRRLSDWEVYLRRIMKLRGMDLPRKPDPSRALMDSRG